ncbi:MAG: phosphotransferase [Desulfurococcales archaeon]|nr:phosphotransferase [Desulfurococcales archaeon]
MPGRCTLEVGSYRVEVVRSQLWMASVEGSTLRVSLTLLRLDAQASLAGERVAGPLLFPVRLSDGCGGDVGGEVRSIIEAYRRRVVVEQLYDVYVRMGVLAREALVDPAFPPVSRLWLLRRPHACLAAEAVSGPGDLRGVYAGLASGVARLVDGMLALDPPSVKLEFLAAAARTRAVAASVASRAPLPRLPWEGDCSLPGWASNPWSLVRLPEGEYRGPCRDPLELLDGAQCRQGGGRFTSSYVCDTPRGRVVLKDYMKMALKWIPAAAASSVAVRYRLGPRSRLAADYHYLRLLRGVLPTPRFLALCSDVARAGAVREYVEGTPVLDSREHTHWRAAGAALGLVHEAGYALGDPNPGNFIVPPGGGRPWLIDAEQAREYTRRRGAWDLVVATAYASMFNVEQSLILEMLSAYLDSWPGARPTLEAAQSPALWLPLQVVPQAARARRLVRRALQAGGHH